MEQAKRRKIEMIAGLILVIVAFLGNGHSLMTSFSFQDSIGIILMILTSVALVFAGLYVGTEFKKTSAKLYKLFLYVLALKQLIGVLVDIEEKIPLFFIICHVLVFALINVLLWVDDLGKMTSIVLSSLVFALELYRFIQFNFISPPFGAVDASFTFGWFLIGFAHTVLPLVLVMMVHLKYVDKEMRKGKD